MKGITVEVANTRKIISAMKKLSIGTSAVSVDTEWEILHKWAADFRNSHHMTIVEFLSLLQLENTSTFTPFLCKRGLAKPPSNLISTQGRKLRDSLKNAKSNYDNNLDPFSTPSTLHFGQKIEGICGEFIFERVSDIRVCNIIFADIDEKNSSIVAEVAGCAENGKVPEDFKKEDYKDTIRHELQKYIFDKLQLKVHVTVSKFTLLVPAASQNAMVCANVKGNGCGTVTVVDHPKVLG